MEIVGFVLAPIVLIGHLVYFCVTGWGADSVPWWGVALFAAVFAGAGLWAFFADYEKNEDDVDLGDFAERHRLTLGIYALGGAAVALALASDQGWLARLWDGGPTRDLLFTGLGAAVGAGGGLVFGAVLASVSISMLLCSAAGYGFSCLYYEVPVSEHLKFWCDVLEAVGHHNPLLEWVCSAVLALGVLGKITG